MTAFAKIRTARFLVNAACVLSLLALTLMVWSVLDPRPIPVMLAMSAGQALGTLSLFAVAVVVIRGLSREPRTKATTPPPAERTATGSASATP